MEKAARFSPDQLRRIARRAIEAVEPDQTIVDAHENELIRTEEQAAREKCSLTLHDNGDGTTTGHFTIPALAAAMLGKVIDAMTAPRRMRAARLHRPATDRSFDWRHRRGLAFAELLEHLPTDHLHSKSAATVVVTIDHTVLAGALKAAHLDTEQALSAGEARRLACNAGILPAVLGTKSVALDLGREKPVLLRSPTSRQRTRTRHLRRHRVRTPLRLVRAPPPTTLGPRRPHRPRRRDPAVLPAPPLDPRHRLQPPDPARRQHPIQQTDMSPQSDGRMIVDGAIAGLGSVERVTTTPPDIANLGQLRASGHQQKSLREEMRANLLDALREGRDPWPGLHGFESTVIPQLERAVIAGHDVVLLGERGQGKTRLLRTLVGLLDEWTPVIAGSELGEHPYEPIIHESKRRALELGDSLEVAWRHRDERYAEKLATPDTSVADLIGDVDPMKVAEGRSLGDPETIHFGLIPRSHRGIVAINELPDLAERIQVAMLNVMEERDIQIRGYVLRLPLDTLVVASANPEDYTNRGRIITPLKDRFGAEIRTHYPIELDDEVAVIRQEAHLVADVPDHLVEILARFTRALRESSSVDQRSGVSARFSIAGAETIAAAALHRATAQGEDEAVARVIDLETAVDVLGGKVEFETGEEGREAQILEHLLRKATAETVRSRLAGVDLGLLVQAIEEGSSVTTGEQITARDFLGGLPVLGESEVYDEICDRLDAGNDGERASAIELALEGLYLAKKVSKESGGGEAIYG